MGEVGGHCAFDSAAFKKQGDHKSQLQSWFSELQEFKEFDFKPIEDKKCDIVISEPTFLIKLDAGKSLESELCSPAKLTFFEQASTCIIIFAISSTCT
jgi:protein O-GlcNAc transferase